ncbi:MAG: Kazal-type serine protease inhibitor [Candidatus Micrarchaeia archaeon]|jgi:hypothetical protein
MNRMILFAALFGVLLLSGCTGTEECGTDRAYVCGEDGNTYTNACYARQAGVRVAYEGQCTQNVTGQCIDSDNGKNALEAGAVSVGTQLYNDSCAGATSVYEYYCTDNAVQSETVLCPAGTECREGSCAAYLCSDTDGGRVQDVLGTVRKGAENRTDVCVDLGTVTEYYCLGNDIADIELACESGESCLNGVCAQLACIETDGGYNIYAKGTLREGSNVYADYCSGISSVREYYCSGDNAVPVTASCGDGYYCSEGACAEYTCRDTDGGRDEDEYGTASKGSDEGADECYDADTVTEYYCSGNEVESTRIDCSSGKICEDGECVTQECSDTDGGNDRADYGTVTVDGSTHRDSCTDLYTLTEYFCDGSNYDDATILCTGYNELCWQNECSPAECDDSDGGRDESIYGTVLISTTNGYSYSESDSCSVDLRSVREKYCSDLKVESVVMDCAAEEVCNGGRCMEAACSDSDGGLNYITPGTTTKGAESATDECDPMDPIDIYECYCSGNEIVCTPHACPDGCRTDSEGIGYCNPL